MLAGIAKKLKSFYPAAIVSAAGYASETVHWNSTVDLRVAFQMGTASLNLMNPDLGHRPLRPVGFREASASDINRGWKV
jgi:hypothetical protein